MKKFLYFIEKICTKSFREIRIYQVIKNIEHIVRVLKQRIVLCEKYWFTIFLNLFFYDKNKKKFKEEKIELL